MVSMDRLLLRGAGAFFTIAGAAGLSNQACAAGRPGYDPGVLRAILFDFNGVLVDDEPIHLEMFQRVLADEGIALSTDDYYSRYLGLDDRACFAAVLAAAGAGGHRPPADAAHRPQGELLPGAHPQARAIRSLPAPPSWCGVPGRTGRDARRGQRRAARGGRGGAAAGGAADLFKVLVTAEDVAESKPDPEGYLRALEGLNSRLPCPSGCSIPTRCWPWKTARPAWRPPRRWASHPRGRPDLSGRRAERGRCRRGRACGS